MTNQIIPNFEALVDRKKLTLPNNAKLAVWIILNVENWSIERAMPRTVLPPPMGKSLIPDIPNWSWHEYGMRSGFWRQHKALQERLLPVTFAINGSVCEKYPKVAEAALHAGWEFMGHGFEQRPMHSLENEEDAIIKTINSIEAFSGARPVSWESPGLTETSNTLHLLRKHGVTNIADWVIDDLPCNVETDFGTVTTIPYTVEMNDIAIYALQNHSSEEILNRGKLQFDRLYSEGEENARIMAISIHPYITGVPHRIAALEALFDYIIDHDDVEWMTAKEIGNWFNKQHTNP